MKLTDILKLILGEAEAIVPIFIHNDKSKQIEAVIVTTANAAMAALAPQVQTPPVAPTV